MDKPLGSCHDDSTWYGGAPAGLNALALCKDVFEERGVAFTPPRVHDTTEDPDRLFERGTQLQMQYMGTQSAARPAPPTEAERAFHRITGEYYWGATWTRLAQSLSVHNDVPGGAGT
jgi:hypothetical protein